jgi:hypothetical protein
MTLNNSVFMNPGRLWLFLFTQDTSSLAQAAKGLKPLTIHGAEASGRKEKARGGVTQDTSFLPVFEQILSKSRRLFCYQK